MRAIRTGEIKPIIGIVDFVAKGYISKDGDRIPCEIGYNEDITPDGDTILRAEYVFIKRDGITERGNHYYKSTIDLNNNWSNCIALDEEF